MNGTVWRAVSPRTSVCLTASPAAPGAGRAVTVRRYAAAAELAAAASAGKRLAERGELRRRARALLADLGVSLVCAADGLTVPVPGARCRLTDEEVRSLEEPYVPRMPTCF